MFGFAPAMVTNSAWCGSRAPWRRCRVLLVQVWFLGWDLRRCLARFKCQRLQSRDDDLVRDLVRRKTVRVNDDMSSFFVDGLMGGGFACHQLDIR